MLGRSIIRIDFELSKMSHHPMNPSVHPAATSSIELPLPPTPSMEQPVFIPPEKKRSVVSGAFNFLSICMLAGCILVIVWKLKSMEERLDTMEFKERMKGTIEKECVFRPIVQEKKYVVEVEEVEVEEVGVAEVAEEKEKEEGEEEEEEEDVEDVEELEEAPP